MLDATSRCLVLVSVVLGSFLSAACSKASGPNVTAAWAYDEAKTVARADSAASTIKTRLKGMVVDLQFRDDNTYTLTITGGPAPTVTQGTFKTGYGEMVLSPTVVDGKSVPPSESHARAPNRTTLELNLGGDIVVLTRR